MARANFQAGGTINTSVFVTPSTSVDNTVNQSVSGDQPIGVSSQYSKLAPIPGATSEAADVNDPIMVYTPNEVTLLNATSAGWTAGDWLKPDLNGNGVTATSGDFYGARALTTMTGLGLGRVLVVIGKR